MPPLLWDHQPCDEAAAAALAEAAGIGLVTARLLQQRGVTTPEAAARFLKPSLDQLHDPFALSGMAAAVDRVLAAIARNERVVIHGDYDADGITSTVILERAISALGGDVSHFIPERIKDGYGLQAPAVERLHAAGARLIISVDCGIRSLEAARRASSLGLDLIVTDHHEPEGELPEALAVLNPRRPDCAYRTRTSRARASRSSWCRRSARGLAGSRGCRDSSRSRPSARSPTSCRSSARTA